MASTREALVLVGHGSHRDPNSAKPVFSHVDTIRSRGCFDEVRGAFWKEEPAIRDVVCTLVSDVVYVVPLFMSDGYFTDRVIPRELGLTAEARRDLEKTVRYTAPVGTHPAMRDVVSNRVETITQDRTDGGELGLALVGHGTPRHAESASSTISIAEALREDARFSQVQALFLDEPPYIGDIGEVFTVRDVVVVPFLVSEGYHVRSDIPEALGLVGPDIEYPACSRGLRIWYAPPVGTDPRMVDVILERANERGAALEVTNATSEWLIGPSSSPYAQFLQWLQTNEQQVTWGELEITGGETSERFAIRHREDRDVPRHSLESYVRPEAAREIARYTPDGRYRPLKSAPTLPRGWVFPDLGRRGLLHAIEEFYPASIAQWALERIGELDVEQWTGAARRHTGRYDQLVTLTYEDVAAVVSSQCHDDACLKSRQWEYDQTSPFSTAPGDGGIPCREPCSVLLERARDRLEER